MKRIYIRILLAVFLPLTLGALALLPVINSANGYVAGFAFLPLLVLVALSSASMFFGGLIYAGTKGPVGFWIVIAAVMLIAGFFGMAGVAKKFELGAYREEPMISFPPPIANKVLFKKTATHDEIEYLWSHVLGYPTGGTSSWTRPGIESIARTQAEDGHEVVTFSFRSGATEEQKDDIRQRVQSYSPVYQYLENVSTSTPGPMSPPVNSNAETKKVIVVDSTTSNK